MTWQLLLMDANAIVCLLIMVRLMFFRKEGKRHRLSVAVLAYLVILAAGFNAFNILLGHYVQVNLGDLLLNSVICMAVWLARGNLAKVVITEAERLLKTGLVSYESDVSRLVKVGLTQGQFDALVSFTYNLGARTLSTSTLLRKLNAGDYAGAADEFLRWNKAGGKVLNGLTRRREAERALFLS